MLPVQSKMTPRAWYSLGGQTLCSVGWTDSDGDSARLVSAEAVCGMYFEPWCAGDVLSLPVPASPCPVQTASMDVAPQREMKVQQKDAGLVGCEVGDSG